MIEHLKIALVLSGGASKGAYQYGFLKAFEEIIPRENVSSIVASSIGIINGYAYAVNDMKRASEFWQKINFDNFFKLIYAVRKSKIVDKGADSFVLKSDKLLHDFSITECKLPNLSVYYWNINNEVLEKTKQLMKIGLSFPFLFKFRKIGKHYFSDGGIIDNIPIYPLFYRSDYDLIIVLHCDPKFRPPKLFFDRGKFVMDFVVNLPSKKKREFFKFKHHRLVDNINIGYEYGKKILLRLFNDGINDFNSLKEEYYQIVLEEAPKRSCKNAFDTLVTIFNNFYWQLYFDQTKL